MNEVGDKKCKKISRIFAFFFLFLGQSVIQPRWQLPPSPPAPLLETLTIHLKKKKLSSFHISPIADDGGDEIP